MTIPAPRANCRIARRKAGFVGLKKFRDLRNALIVLCPIDHAPASWRDKPGRWTALARFGAFLVLTASCCPQFATAQPAKAAIFDLELVDMSQEGERGERADQTARLALASAELRRLFSASGQFDVIDLAPHAARVRERSPLFKCNGCVEELAAAAGADIAVTGIVQKTSNLILSFAIEVKDARSGLPIRGGQVDIRGNTDDTWVRGVRWIVKNRLLVQPLLLERR